MGERIQLVDLSGNENHAFQESLASMPKFQQVDQLSFLDFNDSDYTEDTIDDVRSVFLVTQRKMEIEVFY